MPAGHYWFTKSKVDEAHMVVMSLPSEVLIFCWQLSGEIYNLLKMATSHPHKQLTVGLLLDSRPTLKLFADFVELESSWNTQKAIDWTAEHTEIPVFAIS